MSWQPDRPFNDLPPVPAAEVLETRAVLKACIPARAALAALNQAAALMPNPAMLVNTLPMLEARDSSEIENIVTTADRLFQHAGGAEQQADPATKEALRYRGALYWGAASLRERPLSTATAVEVCRQIKGVALDVRRTPGTQLVNDRSGEVVYTPPQGEAVLRGLLADWERFLHEATDVDPLVRMAAAHYQFEAIHPFVDGNGRTGRVLNLLFLLQAGLLDLPILYLSRAILRRKSDYYRLLREVTQTGGQTGGQAGWEPWLRFMLQGVEETAQWTTAKILAIRALADHTAQHVRERAPKVYSRELVDVVFEQPYCRIANLVERGIAQRQAASRYLHALAELGVLTPTEVGKEKLFVHPGLLRLLASETHEVVRYT
ncbi:MAG: Fic family protein [Gammaproteobacteria bacterium]|nr:Fic family protein [Gammaproteobacteria bacterium]MCK6425881.1 Fic family protein [Burkholderiaceae bacterium]